MNFKVSIIASAIPALQYIYINYHFITFKTTPFFIGNAKGLLIIVCGCLSAIIAKTIKEGVIESLESKNMLINELDRLVKEKTADLENANEELQQQNEEILSQRDEIEKQKHKVEEHQKEIIDSITYAKRIQEAILPPQEFVSEHIPENFILYLPKDIVAGDFYWMHTSNSEVSNSTNTSPNQHIFIAVADSTGHGVPGAMVSVVCSNALNRAVKEFELTDTGKILDKTRELVVETFEKSSSDVKDGMDISLLYIDKENKKISWSGANNSLWYINAKNILVEIKSDKQPIGKSDHSKNFTTHNLEFEFGTVFYLFTDGYADQFGGEREKKFKYKPLQEILIENNHLPLSEQSEILQQKFLAWKGNLEQVDDVTIIGIKI